MNTDRDGYRMVIGALVALVIVQSFVIWARDDRRMRALEFAQRVQERVKPSASAGT